MRRSVETPPPGSAVIARPTPAERPIQPGTPVPRPRQAPRGRPRLWALDASYHCPIIGTCLHIDELKRIAKRCSFAARPDNAFALHVEAVSLARSRNGASEAIQQLLDRKYRAVVDQFSRLKSDAELLVQWQASVARGDVAGPLWAICTHRAASATTLQTVYQDIHMLSHQIGAGQATDTRRLKQLEHENTELRSGLKRELAALRRQLAAAESGLAERDAARIEARVLQTRLARFESGQVMIDLGRRLMSLQGIDEKLAAATRRIHELEGTLRDAHREAVRLATERDTALGEKAALETLLHASLPPPAEAIPCARAGSDDCAGCSDATTARCVLYVGGRAALIAQYRQLASRLGIRLIHHDGGLEESLSRLPELIGGADAVLCPTDRISHNAYHHVKAHCKRVGKPCLFYQGGGVSGFAVAMARVRRGEYSLAAAGDD